MAGGGQRVNAPVRPHDHQWFYPTAFLSWGQEEYDAVQRVVASGRFTMGPEVEAFESEFAAYLGRRRVVMVNSGSSANLVAAIALNPPQNLSVAVPALAWGTTYSPFALLRSRFYLMDCDPDTWNVSKETMRVADIVVLCPILGNPAGLSEVSGMAIAGGRTVLEVACESLGAEIDGRRAGTFGHISTFSFYFSHQLSAIEGGAIATDDDELADTCIILRDHGLTRGLKHNRTIAEEFEFLHMGFNFRPVEINAAVAREQLRKFPQIAHNRVHNFGYFWFLAKDIDEIDHPVSKG